MTPSALRAKAQKLVDDALFYAPYPSGEQFKDDLTAFVEALLALAYAIDDTSDLIEDTRVLAALSRLEELTR